MILFNIQSSEQGSYYYLHGDYAVRRIICTSTASQTSTLESKGTTIGCFNQDSPFEISFESYYGYPKLSDLSIFQYGYGAIAVDIVPHSPSNDNYFEIGEANEGSVRE